MIVVKLGGSFFDSPELIEWLKVLSEHGAGKVVIVPGGGPFADQVRNAQKQHGFNDSIAHKMALHAMDQFGFFLIGMAEKNIPDHKLIAANSEQKIREAIINKQTPVWLPSQQLKDNQDIPQNWTVTSDSLSAWLAKELIADQLVLIKRTNADLERPIKELEQEGVIDSSFINFIEQSDFKMKFLNVRQVLFIKDFLKEFYATDCVVHIK
ncbi:MAG: hypothetical protein AB8D52_08020 [Gammaproteobacteria bacterium]